MSKAWGCNFQAQRNTFNQLRKECQSGEGAPPSHAVRRKAMDMSGPVWVDARGHHAPFSWALEAGAGPRPILSSSPGLFSWHLEDSTYPSSYTSLTLVTKWPTDIYFK